MENLEEKIDSCKFDEEKHQKVTVKFDELTVKSVMQEINVTYITLNSAM